MKVIILAGGYGTRLGDITENIPKPMVKIGEDPILIHIMRRYAKFGFNDFIIALGYKKEIIKNYFFNLKLESSDLTIDFSGDKIEFHDGSNLDWKVTLVDTGKDTLTGGRLLRLRKYIGTDTFMLTYGDGLTDINFQSELLLHRKAKKMVTVTAVRPSARFGELTIKNNIVTSFEEKPQVQHGWVNGGFFIMEPEFLDLIEDDSTILEQEPLKTVTQSEQLHAYLHKGFWQCMDTRRDMELLEKIYNAGHAPWTI
jgi:glucose-1-phosphate cytidylyltransferase